MIFFIFFKRTQDRKNCKSTQSNQKKKKNKEVINFNQEKIRFIFLSHLYEDSFFEKENLKKKKMFNA